MGCCEGTFMMGKQQIMLYHGLSEAMKILHPRLEADFVSRKLIIFNEVMPRIS